MAKTKSKNMVSVPRAEYKRLKELEKKFEVFWNYLKYLMDIREARKDIEAGRVEEQEKLFRRLGF